MRRGRASRRRRVEPGECERAERGGCWEAEGREGKGSMRALRADGRNGMAVAGSAGVGEKERGGSSTGRAKGDGGVLVAKWRRRG